MQSYLPSVGGAALILIGAAFLLINLMDQTVWRFMPAFAAILVGATLILWKLPHRLL